MASEVLSTQLRELAAKAKLYDVTAEPDHPEVLTGPYAAIDCSLGEDALENFARAELIVALVNNLDHIAAALDAVEMPDREGHMADAIRDAVRIKTGAIISFDQSQAIAKHVIEHMANVARPLGPLPVEG